MPIKWKNFYFNSQPMKNTKYFITLNRIAKQQYESTSKKWFGDKKNEDKKNHHGKNNQAIYVIDFPFENFTEYISIPVSYLDFKIIENFYFLMNEVIMNLYLNLLELRNSFNFVY